MYRKAPTEQGSDLLQTSNVFDPRDQKTLQSREIRSLGSDILQTLNVFDPQDRKAPIQQEI